jgi:hypothetical protein
VTVSEGLGVAVELGLLLGVAVRVDVTVGLLV